MSQFHKKPVTHINHVAIKVTNLKQSITFYKEVLGLNVLTDDGNNVQLSANNIDPLITLVQIKNPTKKHTKTTGLYHFAILLPTRDDLAQFLQHVIDKQIPIGASDHRVSEAIYLNDPDGNGIEVYCDRPAESWTWVHEQVTMTTKKLDMTNLLAEKTKSWDIIPTDALIGHLHLHVDNLESNKQFYQAIGFSVVTEYPGALFMSFGKYHHHLAINIWNGIDAPHPKVNEPGLHSFVITYGTDEARQKAIKMLNDMNVPMNKDGDNYIVQEPSGSNIILSV